MVKGTGNWRHWLHGEILFEINLRGGPGVYQAGSLAVGRCSLDCAWMEMFQIEALIDRRDGFLGAEAY